MAISTNTQIKTGAIFSYLQMALNIIIGIAYTPIMIRLLGKSEYGLYNTVTSTISMMSILSLGFKSGYVRYYAKYKKENNTEGIYKLNGLFMIVFSVIGVVALICGLFLAFNLKLVFDEGLTQAEYQTARILMLLLAINMSTSFPASVFATIISSNEKFVFLKLIGAIRTVLSPLITLPLLLLGYGSIAIVIVSVVLSWAVDIIYVFFVIFKLKNKFIFYGFEKGLFKSIFAYTGFIAIHLIVDQINLNFDKVLLGRFKGTEIVAVYSIGYSLYQYYLSFSTPISGVFIPRVHHILNSANEEQDILKKNLTEIFVKVGRVQFAILGLLMTGLIFFGRPFIYFWAGDGYQEAYYVMLLLALPGTIDLIQNLGIEIQRAQNKHKFRAIVSIIMAFANIIISIILAQKYGAIGAAIGTAISFLLVQGLILNIYYHKKCNIDVLVFWKNILRMCLGLIIPIICGIFIMYFANLYVIWKLLLLIIVYTCIYCVSMWFCGINKNEKDLIRKPIKKIFCGLRRRK